MWPVLRNVAKYPEHEWLEEILAGYQYSRDLYSALNPIPHAAKSLRRLAPVAKIVYITARPMFAREDTQAWLMRHGFPVGEVINVRNDNKVAAARREKIDTMIEDRPRYANQLAEAGIDVVLLDVYDRALGHLHEDITVVTSWYAIMRLLRREVPGL